MKDAEKQKVLEFVKHIQKIKDEHIEEGKPINYGTICGLVIEGWNLVKELGQSVHWRGDSVEDLIDKIHLILVEEGQHDLRFKLGEIIKYSPSEIREILLKHKDELG